MENKVYASTEIAFWMEMEKETMQDVLGDRPGQNAQYNPTDALQHRNLVHKEASVSEIQDNWNVQKQRNGKVHFGKQLHKVVFEHSD